MQALLLLCISLFHGWRYSKTSVDPDWAYFNLWGFTGSVYGRDFVDCKTPGVHLWYLALTKLVGKNVARVKFANHFLLGAVGVLLYWMTGNFHAALAYTVLINSGWFLAFHGNVGQVPAALIVLALSTQHSALSAFLWLAAVFYEPKLVLSFAVYAILSGWWYVAVLLLPIGLIGFLYKDRPWFRQLWESSVTIPLRIGKGREGDNKMYMPWFTSNVTLYLAPWVAFSLMAKPDFFYWLPAIVYLIVIVLGKVVRQNHFIPIIPWLALSGIDPVIWVIVDFVSSGFYFGNIWWRYYPALSDLNRDAEQLGEWMKDKAGTMYLNGIHSGVYIHAGKPVLFGFAEQIEIREVATERRKEMITGWKANPPDYVIEADIPGIVFDPSKGYRRVHKVGGSAIYQRSSPMGQRSNARP